MIEKLYLAYADGSDPARNLAIASVLMDNVLPGEIILYIWQNDNTVLIGRNQDIRKEVNLKAIERDGVHVMRSSAGGAAIYHDTGNLNFSFIARDGDFSAERQTAIILDAIRSLGFDAEIKERGDIFINGKKVTGGGFYHYNGASLQYGTVLVNCDISKVMEYIVPDPERFSERGLAQISSRMANLCDTIPSVTVEEVGSSIVSACEREYNTKNILYNLPNRDLLEQKEFLYRSRTWIYGRSIEYDHSCEKRFSWGQLRFEFQTENGEISNLRVLSDSTEPTVIDDIREALLGVPFNTKAMVKALRYVEKSQERDDAIALIEEQEY
ncbi:MAG: lipoate--protein ligase [Oscillospiraceae bacterium]|nr:lipoate--protein ligase [Oscillospiraceae bacterium]